MRTRSDQVTDALDVLTAKGVKLDEIFERYKASIVEAVSKDYIAKERGKLAGEILAVLNSDSGTYVWRESGVKVIFDNYFLEYYLDCTYVQSIALYKKRIAQDKLSIRQMEYLHLRLVEQPEFRPAQESLLEAV